MPAAAAERPLVNWPSDPVDWPEDGLDGDGADQGEPRWLGDMLASGEPSQPARLTAWVRGRVQGVGFRWWVRKNALELGLVGFAENLVDGRVKVIAEGTGEALTELLGRLEGPQTPGQVTQVTHRWDEFSGGLTGFAER
jgi:acylphosphatase